LEARTYNSSVVETGTQGAKVQEKTIILHP
jgi:hypothetical protein